MGGLSIAASILCVFFAMAGIFTDFALLTGLPLTPVDTIFGIFALPVVILGFLGGLRALDGKGRSVSLLGLLSMSFLGFVATFTDPLGRFMGYAVILLSLAGIFLSVLESWSQA